MDDDPGWGSPWKVLLGVVLLPIMIGRSDSSTAPLVTMRSLFLSYVTATIAFGLTLPFIVTGDDTGEPSLSVTTAAIGVGALGLLGLVASSVISRELECGSAQQVVGQYRTRFFLQVAFAESAALYGFVASFLSESTVPYLVGGAIAMLGFALMAPTRAHVLRERDELRTRGCPHDLFGLLAGRDPAV